MGVVQDGGTVSNPALSHPVQVRRSHGPGAPRPRRTPAGEYRGAVCVCVCVYLHTLCVCAKPCLGTPQNTKGPIFQCPPVQLCPTAAIRCITQHKLKHFGTQMCLQHCSKGEYQPSPPGPHPSCVCARLGQAWSNAASSVSLPVCCGLVRGAAALQHFRLVSQPFTLSSTETSRVNAQHGWLQGAGSALCPWDLRQLLQRCGMSRLLPGAAGLVIPMCILTKMHRIEVQNAFNTLILDATPLLSILRAPTCMLCKLPAGPGHKLPTNTRTCTHRHFLWSFL